MSQLTITNGQTPLLVSDFIKKAKAKNASFLRVAPDGTTLITDFLTVFKNVLPSYAAAYAKRYYITPSNISAPNAFGTAIETSTFGNVYEEPVPSDCMDDGVVAVSITYNSTLKVPSENILNSNTETEWDLDSGNAYWRNDGRKVRMFVPIAFSASSPKRSFSFKRLPTIPQADGDSIDAPAEDIDTLFDSWYGALVQP